MVDAVPAAAADPQLTAPYQPQQYQPQQYQPQQYQPQQELLQAPYQQQLEQQQQQGPPPASATQLGIGQLHERRPGSKVHFCLSCTMGIMTYGRLLPCKHAFCLECATSMPRCLVCGTNVGVIDKVTEPLHISAVTMQSFHTAEQLAQNTRAACAKLSQAAPIADAMQHFQQQWAQQHQHQLQQSQHQLQQSQQQ